MRFFLLLLILQAFKPFETYAQQESKEVEIVNADLLRMKDEGGISLSILTGSVVLRQTGTLMYCDSAIINRANNDVDAYGSVRIVRDSVRATSKMLHHDGLTEITTLKGAVYLTDRHMELRNELLYYRMKDNIAYYLNGADIRRGNKTRINSQIGYYYADTEDLFFSQNVNITDSAYRLKSDSLQYNTATEISTFLGPTLIMNQAGDIYCESGWYDARKELSAFGKNTIMNNPPSRLETDTLYYDRGAGFARLPAYFHYTDSSKNTEIFANKGYYRETDDYLLSTEHPLLLIADAPDTLLLIADTLMSYKRSNNDSLREFHAYRNVKIYSTDMRGICDSLTYTFSDSSFRFFYDPVMWSDGTQICGDSLVLLTKNKKAEKLWVKKRAFIASRSGKLLFDQVRGAQAEAWFDSSRMERVLVSGKAQSLYFGKEEDGGYVGANKADCEKLWMYFRSGKMSKIVFVQKPVAIFTPMSKLKEDAQKLNGFRNRFAEEPSDRSMFLNFPRKSGIPKFK